MSRKKKACFLGRRTLKLWSEEKQSAGLTCDLFGMAGEARDHSIVFAVINLPGVVHSSSVHNIFLAQLHVQSQDASLREI